MEYTLVLTVIPGVIHRHRFQHSRHILVIDHQLAVDLSWLVQTGCRHDPMNIMIGRSIQRLCQIKHTLPAAHCIGGSCTDL